MASTTSRSSSCIATAGGAAYASTTGHGLGLASGAFVDPAVSAAMKPGASTQTLIVVGASTGGTEAIKALLIAMPVDCPPILIVQHMPESFTATFAQRLNGLCRIEVTEAQHGEPVRSGHAYIAPGHSHLLLVLDRAGYVTELSPAPAVNRHRPSVDVLFRSVARCAGKNALGVILTGMGKDGAAGMLEMKRAGALTFAQDEASCVVFGMPKEAIALGGVDEIVPLAAMAGRVLEEGRVKRERGNANTWEGVSGKGEGR